MHTSHLSHFLATGHGNAKYPRLTGEVYFGSSLQSPVGLLQHRAARRTGLHRGEVAHNLVARSQAQWEELAGTAAFQGKSAEHPGIQFPSKRL